MCKIKQNPQKVNNISRSLIIKRADFILSKFFKLPKTKFSDGETAQDEQKLKLNRLVPHHSIQDETSQTKPRRYLNARASPIGNKTR